MKWKSQPVGHAGLCEVLEQQKGRRSPARLPPGTGWSQDTRNEPVTDSTA